MSHLKWQMKNSVLQPIVDGEVLPIKLDTQQLAVARRAGTLTAFVKTSILKRLRRELDNIPKLTPSQRSAIMLHFSEVVE
jgi:hypothetical protein